ncbi:unnamed protein product [Lactuca saligna]|uniref:Uncharacterized protein n=1 Tax=Lactuca saligna TaxID=75948 RepID=A0AA35Y9Z7_LACSI|nr:unnamed protein product [Lactuca saligna]
MASFDVASPPTDDPYKPFAYVNFVILTYSLGYNNFDYSFFLFEKKIRRFSEKKMNADPWARPNFNLWTVSAEPPKNKPVVEYEKANDKRFTIRVVHGGFFTDYPGKAYQQTKVHSFLM